MPDQATCGRCGTPVPPGARHCPTCGADVSSQQGQVATAYVAPGDAPRMALGQSGQLEALRRATLGEYDIQGELGQGGMATVYLAHDIALDRKVAIKVMSPALFSTAGMVERFKREARTAAALSHPHIIPIFAVRESADLVYFVMKFIEGRSLESILRAAGPLPLPLVRAVLYQVGEALGYAHRRGVVHRDVKPANIMLDTDGWVVVTDFGIAKVSETQGLTMTGATIGTPSYMSPEQCEAKRELTGASDQYSLGIVAYEMLSGRLPFVADTTVGLLYAQVHEPPPPIADLRPDCPPETAAALMRMLEKDAAKRWPDIECAMAALGGAPLTRDDPIRAQLASLGKAKADADVRRLATPVSPLPPTRGARPKPAKTTPTAARRVPALLWALPAVALAVAAGWWLATRSTRTAPPAVPAALPSPAVETTVAAAPRPPAETAITRATPAPVSGAPVPPTASEQFARPEGAALPPAREGVRAGGIRFARAQARALSVREHAVSAGATPADLAAGDRQAEEADALAQQGRVGAALIRLAGASAAWSQAGQRARARPEPSSGPAPPPGEATGPRAAIEETVAALARAFESRNLAQVRQVYPNLTVQQAQEWGEFFMGARDLRVSLRVTSLEALDDRAQVGIEGSYDYEDLQTGRGVQRPVAFRGTFVREGGGWRLTSLR